MPHLMPLKLLIVLILIFVQVNVFAQKADFAPVADKLQAATYTEFYNSSGAFYNQTNTGNTNFNYWWNAHGVDAILDDYIRTRSDLYKRRMKSLLLGIKANDGGDYPTSYYDDMAWLAIASLRAYENTGDTEYLNAVNALWTDMKTGQHTAQGGALQWNKSAPNSFNACTNGPAIILATRLYRVKGTAADLDTAKSIYTWMKNTLVNSTTGEVWDSFDAGTNVTNKSWIFSYNQGTWIGACLELYKVTGEQTYLDEAVKTANTAIKNNMTGGILYPNSGGGDGGLFQGIFIRYLTQFAREADIPQATKDQYIKAIKSSAQALKDKGINATNNTVSPKWGVAPGATTDYSSQLSGIMLVEAASTFDQVDVYTNSTYGGKQAYFSVGNFTLAQLVANGITDNTISSITIPAGLKVTAYADDNFLGDSVVFASNQSIPGDWDNEISSMKITQIGSGNGLKGEYYASTDFSTLKFSQTDENVNFDWGTSSPNETSLGTDQFSVRWSGFMQPLYSGKYTFYVTADDGSKLTIDKTILIDSLNASGLNISSDTMTLVAGQKYFITLEYVENTENASCKLEWESNQQERQVIPKSQLYTRASSSTDVVTAYPDCNYIGLTGGMNVGDYTLADLNNLGILNKDISSLKVNQGFKAILYENDHFEGSSIEVTADTSCLNDWIDRVSSIKVRANGDTTLDGTYFLLNKSSGYNMEVAGGITNTDDAANVQQGSVSGYINQQFKFTLLDDGAYSIVALHSNKPIEVSGFSKTAGANVQQMSALGTDNQEFVVVPTENGYYKLIAKHSGDVVEAASNLSQANVRQWVNNNQAKGQWKLNPVPANVNGSGTGLNAEYFKGSDFETSVFSKIDTTINFDWGTSAPDSRLNADNFSIRWTGKIQPRFTGTYTFYINSDNGRRLWIDNQLIIDKWLSDYDVEYSGSVALSADQLYDFKMEYFEETGGASCELEWSGEKQSREIVPKSQLYRINAAIDNPRFENDHIEIFPNPVINKTMHIEINDTNEKQYNVVLFDILGKEVFKTSINKSSDIHLNGVAEGNYIVSIRNNSISINKHVLVQ